MRMTRGVWTAVIASTLVSSQLIAGGGVVMTDAGCTMHIDFYSARFTAYQPETRGNEEFCNDLPDLGPTVFVLDYLHDSLRQVPVDFRIIRDVTGQGRFAKWEDVMLLGDLEPHTVFYRPPEIRPDASLQVEFDFVQKGRYIGIVTAGHPTSDSEHRAVFPFEVARTSLWPWLAPVAVALFLVAWRVRRRPHGAAAMPGQPTTRGAAP